MANKYKKIEKNRHNWQKEPYVYSEGGECQGNRPTAVELFCGPGGLSLGLNHAGFTIVLGLDIHEPSIQTFSDNHESATVILGDIRKVDSDMVEQELGGLKVDVLAAGVPCQGFSINNKKRNQHDERNFLYKEFLKYIEVLNPSVAVLENVSGMKSTAEGKFVDNIARGIEKSGEMNVNYSMLNAANFGVPQERERLVFVGTKSDKFSFKQLRKNYSVKKNVTVQDAIFDLPSLQPGEKKSRYNKEPKSDYQKLMRKKSDSKFYNHEAPNHQDSTVERIKNTVPGEPMYEKFQQRIRLSWSKPSPTQVAGGIRPQFQLGHPNENRGLTVRERCRIQSFPDNFVIKGGMVQGRVQTGNAVPPLLAKAIGNQIIKEHI